MKVLMVGPSVDSKGGIATVINNILAKGFAEKTEIHFIASTNDKSRMKQLIKYGLFWIKFVFFLGKCDLVHVHTASRGSWFRKSLIMEFCIKCNKSYVIHLHGAEFMKFYNSEMNCEKRKQVARLFNKAKRVIVLSEEWKENIKGFCDDKKIDVLWNTTHIPEIDWSKKADGVVTFLGRIDKRKGIFELIPIIKKLSERYPGLLLMIGGDGDIGKLNDIINENQCSNNVKYLGWITGRDKHELLEKSSINVLFSYDEGMPMTLIEAMAYGNAVISTNVGGIPTLIRNGKDGILIKSGDKDNLERSLNELLSDSDVRDRLTKQARNRVIDEFSMNSYFIKLKRIYSEIEKC